MSRRQQRNLVVMANNWYCQINGSTLGPLSRDELDFLAARGRLSHSDVIRAGGDEEWQPAASLPGLFVDTKLAGAKSAGMSRGHHASGENRSPRGTAPGSGDASHGPAVAIRPPDRVLPTERQPDDRRKRLLMGSGIGSAVVLLILLLLWLFWPQRPQSMLAGTGTASEAAGDGTPGFGGAGDQFAAASALNDSSTGMSQAADDDVGEAAGSAESMGEDDASDGDTEASLDGEETESPQPAPASALAVVDDTPPEPQVFSIQRLEAVVPQPTLGQPARLGRQPKMFAARTAENRAELAQSQGGTAESEAAVNLGLDWLARHQHVNGAWTLDTFHQAGDCRGQCTHPGLQSDVAGTSLALMAFLGAGQTHKNGHYADAVQSALRWLVQNQRPDGSFASIGGGNMYAHGQAAIALCEGLAMTGDRDLRRPAQSAINYIVRAQHQEGGWRYAPGQQGDTSVLGWQVMALKSAQSAELEFPDHVFRGATLFLDSAQADNYGGLYSYMPRQRAPSPAMTAEGLLCRQYTGWPKRHPGLSAGVNYLMTQLPQQDAPNMYYWYYATQVLHHMGGQPWNRWNDVIREILIETQVKEGHAAGSWRPHGNHDARGGRVYMTALAVCTLEVYYRHSKLYAD